MHVVQWLRKQGSLSDVIQILALHFNSCVTLGSFLTSLFFQFSHLSNGGDDNDQLFYCVVSWVYVFVCEINGLTCMKYLEQDFVRRKQPVLDAVTTSAVTMQHLGHLLCTQFMPSTGLTMRKNIQIRSLLSQSLHSIGRRQVISKNI